MTISEVIKKRREELGLSQKDIVLKLGKSDTMLSNIESGKTKKVSLDTTKEVADALDWDMIELLQAVGYLTPEDMQRHKLCQFSNCENLSVEDQQYIQLFIDACAHKHSNEVK